MTGAREAGAGPARGRGAPLDGGDHERELGADVRALASRPVLDAEGRRAGRVQDIYLRDASAELVALVISHGSCDAVVPAHLFSLRGDGRLRMDLRARALRRCLPAPITGHLTGEELEQAHAAAERAREGDEDLERGDRIPRQTG